MPSEKRRGAHPQDGMLFSPGVLPLLRQAVSDLSWMRSRGYAENSALKLVGDRYQLTTRQRSAVGRCACSDQGLHSRSARLVRLEDVQGREVWIDGFNLLITLEAALAGGLVFRGRDGCLRDLSSLHGNYHLLEDTRAAARLTCEILAEYPPSRVVWLLDKPVSNSGRLATLLRSIAGECPQFPSEVDLVPNPDRILIHPAAGILIVSSDSLILASDIPWLNLARHIVERNIPEARLIDLGMASQPAA